MKVRLIITAFLGATTIILGAFGAHALSEQIEPAQLSNFQTGVKYMMFHIITLLVINTSDKLPEKKQSLVSNLFFLGILFFSGSLFVISTGIIAAKSIWFITPLGGLILILGWILLGFAYLKNMR